MVNHFIVKPLIGKAIITESLKANIGSRNKGK